MEWWLLLILYIVFTVVVGGPVLFIFTEPDGCESVNPLWIYENIDVNWFGVICLSILFHVIALPYAIGYWFYKLCTVGRKTMTNFENLKKMSLEDFAAWL